MSDVDPGELEALSRAAGDRFRVIERLGSGAMGVVYRAHDRELGHDVALKVLRSGIAESFRLKSEFRALADVRHRNLVVLHDLVVAETVSFFTMELVRGVDLATWVRGNSPGAPSDAGLERLRRALPQLLEGLERLHAVGRVHRDIKPSNVLVDDSGRVVLVDFGLAFVRPIAGAAAFDAPDLAGTPAYMAPELFWGGEPSAASDAYALGATLFEVLTGEPPFTGSLRAHVQRRPESPGPSPRSRVAAIPADLDAVVSALLDGEPARRPPVASIRAELGAAAGLAEPGLVPAAAALWEAPFVDREDALAALGEALAGARAGGAVAIRIEGPSGIGKSALVRHFLATRGAEQPLVVLAGRCYPQESVPFKALDPLIDGLTQRLEKLSPSDLLAVVPEQTQALLRLFPVLGRIPRLAAIASGSELPSEPEEIRRSAFDQLRELLRRLGARFQLVLWIDDLQWGDLDSAAFLRTLLAAADAPAVLILLTYRSAEWEVSAMRAALLRADGTPLGRRLELEPLAAEPALRLADMLLSRGAAPSTQSAEDVVREAHGNPFLVCELARHYATSRATPRGGDGPFGIGEIVADRIRPLEESARRLLRVVSVAGGPCAVAVAAHAAGLDRRVATEVTALRNLCLLRDSSAGDASRLETYHDRIRESVVEQLAAGERRAIHLSLAAALERQPGTDPLELVEHYRGGGDGARAARSAVLAAERAFAALAFEQAARLYEVALEVGGGDVARWRWLRGRADALAQAGRGAEAGEDYRRAAAGVSAERGEPAVVEELVRLSAEQFLRSGYVDEGRAALREVLRAVGERYPETHGGALLSLVRQRSALALRGLGHVRREARAVSARKLRQIDACWAAAEGLIWADGLRSADFQARYTRLALAAGEPTRVVRALCTEAAFQALIGGRFGGRRASRALGDARALAADLGSPLAEGLTAVCEAGAAYLSGHFPEGHRQSLRAEEILRSRCTGVAWELTNAHIFASWSLAHMGDLAALRATMPELLVRARERGDLLAYCTLLGGLPNTLRLLAGDALDEARAAVDESLARWPTRDFQLPSYFAMVSAAHCDLYAGDAAAATRRIEETWPKVRGIGLLAFRLVRTEARELRARCRLATSGPADLGGVRRAIRRIAREEMPWATPFAAALTAKVAAISGDESRQQAALQSAASGFEVASMRLWAASALLRGGDVAGSATLRAQGVRDPARFAAMLLP